MLKISLRAYCLPLWVVFHKNLIYYQVCYVSRPQIGYKICSINKKNQRRKYNFNLIKLVRNIYRSLPIQHVSAFVRD